MISVNTEMTDAAVSSVGNCSASGRDAAQGHQARWQDGILLGVLPLAALMVLEQIPAWAFMWAMALDIFFGCKWLTWRRTPNASRVLFGVALSYFFAWPGMDAAAFSQGKSCAETPNRADWLFAALKTIAGAALVWFAARETIGGAAPLLTGWLGMIGLVLLLHFGLFHLLALAWRRGGVGVRLIMRAPLAATSLADFWSARWNTAFNGLAHKLALRPLAHRFGVRCGTLGVFLISGLIHELVLSLPARGGYGLPTAYFILQGVGVLAERSLWGRRLGLGRGLRGWLFTAAFAAAPAFWLFHPPFVYNVILPMLRAFGAS